MSQRISLRSCVCISSLCALGLTLSFEHQAAAQEGFALNRFDPAEQAGVFFRGDSLDIAGDRRWAAGLVADWGHKVLVAYDEDGHSELATVIGDQLFFHLGGSLILVDRLRVGLNIPLLAYQNATHFDATGIDLTPSEDFSLGDIRLGADVRLLGETEQPLRLAAGLRVYLPSGNRDAFASDGSTRLAPSVSAAGDLAQFVYAASTGFMIRTEGRDFVREHVGSEMFLSLAGGVRLLDTKLVVGPELFVTTDIADGKRGFLRRKTTPVELILGCHYDVAKDVRLGFGFGPGLTEGLGEPATRWLASLQWAPGAEPKEEPPLDRDGDGIPDVDDRCPDEPGVVQSDPALNGCPLPPMPPDTDADGITDDLDACPTLAGPENREDPAKNGCPPPPDQDGDGIADAEDACPTEPGVAKPDDPAKNGCPEPADTDGDGITDDQDACPKDSGLANEDPAKNGCPLAVVRESRIEILERIEFETAKARLTPASDKVLEAVAKALEEHPEITKVSVEGHTDNKGPIWLNRRLSKQRAAAVVDWLVKQGIASERLTSAGFGPERPLQKNNTEAGRQANRRVEFQIIELNGKPNPAQSEGR
ncbi:MAG: OmpA family protein [Polyangiaceae bacterium]|nr:OmpA family protein [Polyangiaceae bacterium]